MMSHNLKFNHRTYNSSIMSLDLLTIWEISPQHLTLLQWCHLRSWKVQITQKTTILRLCHLEKVHDLTSVTNCPHFNQKLQLSNPARIFISSNFKLSFNIISNLVCVTVNYLSVPVAYTSSKQFYFTHVIYNSALDFHLTSRQIDTLFRILWPQKNFIVNLLN